MTENCPRCHFPLDDQTRAARLARKPAEPVDWERVVASGSVEEERVEALSWALDLLDMYDEKLIERDGTDKVLTPIHVAAKRAARAALAGNVAEAHRWREEISRLGHGLPPKGDRP